ncbi:hypothetical protein HPB47_016232, partial [Ixodes persulcatus]
TAKRRLNARFQQSNESFTAYIEDVLTLCRRSNPNMTEAERIRHLLKGIAEQRISPCSSSSLQPPSPQLSMPALDYRRPDSSVFFSLTMQGYSEEPQRSFVFNTAVASLTSAQAPPLTPWRQDHSYQQPYRQRPVCCYCGIIGHVARLCRHRRQNNEARYHCDSYLRSSRRDNSRDYDDGFRGRHISSTPHRLTSTSLPFSTPPLTLSYDSKVSR